MILTLALLLAAVPTTYLVGLLAWAFLKAQARDSAEANSFNRRPEQ
jgi:hypothetical protein